MECNRDRLQHSCFCKRKIFRQAIENARRNGDIFCKSSGAAKLGARDSQDLAVVAEIHVSPAAVVASAAKDGRVEGDPFAFCESAHSSTERGDCSRSFVPHNKRRNAPTRRAIITVNVTATDAARGYAYYHFTVARLGVRKMGNFQMLVFREQKSFHERRSFIRARLLVSRE